MESGTIAKKIFSLLAEESRRHIIEEVRIGVCYTGVQTTSGLMGLAATPYFTDGHNCRTFSHKDFPGRNLSDLLLLLADKATPLERALGLAAANALANFRVEGDHTDAIKILNLTSGDRVCMVGMFHPLVKKIRGTGAVLSILERIAGRGGLVEKADQVKALESCTIAIITATTIINGSIESVLGRLSRPRHVAVLGPSTPMLPSAFVGTLVNHLGGSMITDKKAVMRIISEAGGTPAMRPFLKRINILMQGSK